MRKTPRSFSSLHFAFKTSLVLSGSIFALTILLTYLIGVGTRQRIEYDQGTFLSELAFNFAKSLDQSIHSRFGEIRTLSALDSIANPRHSLESKKAVLEQLVESFSEISWIGIADVSGKVLVSNKGLLQGADVSQRPWFKNGLQKPSIGDVHEALLLNKLLGGSEQEPIRFVDVSAPLYHKGKLVGVIGAHLSWKWAEQIGTELLAPLLKRFPVTLTIYSQDGKILLGDKKRDYLDLDKVAALGTFGSYYIDQEKGRQDLLVGTARTKFNPNDAYVGFGWIVALDRESRAAFAIARSFEYKILGAGVLIAIALALAGLRYKQQEEKSLALAEDLGEARAAEEAARSSSAAKSHFLAAMSHEIRTPMNGVMGVADLLLETDLTDQQKSYASLIKVSADSLLSVINDILDYSKVEANKIELEKVPFSLSATVTQTLSLLDLQARNKALYLRVVNKPDENFWVAGDPVRLRQVLINLISNGLKFTSHGGVEVSFSHQELGDGHVVIKFEVKDSGIGIPPQAQQRIFERFEQADSSTNRKYGGTGLGLSISKSLVKLMGGEMGVESVVGEGSIFWFTIKLIKATAPGKDLVSDIVAAPRKKLSVLVAEDNSVNQMIIRAMLSKLGHNTHVVENGIKAIEALREKDYDVVLMDCHMPEMDGYQATMAIREENRWMELPIVALTASAMDEEREHCLQVGMTDYLSKPVQLKTLDKMLQKHSQVRS